MSQVLETAFAKFFFAVISVPVPPEMVVSGTSRADNLNKTVMMMNIIDDEARSGMKIGMNLDSTLELF